MNASSPPSSSLLASPIPFRLELLAQNSPSNPSTIVQIIDWVNFVPFVPSFSWLNTPANCQPGALSSNGNSNSQRVQMPTSNSLSSQAADVNIPSLPKQFTATLEATFFTTPPAFNSSFSPISNQSNVTQSKPVVPVMHSFTVVWSMDVPNARARFDYYMNDNTTSKTLVASYLHRYTLGHKKNIFAWGTRGSVWSSVRNLMDGQTIGKPTCQASDADISGPMQSPLLQMRAGLIPSMFVESSSLLQQLFSLINRSSTSLSLLIRNVPVDLYRTSQSQSIATNVWQPRWVSPQGTLASDGSWVAMPTQLDVNTDIMFYPKGWAFPGLSLQFTQAAQSNSSLRIPIRVQQTGTETNLSGSYKFVDTWELYALSTDPIPESRFDPVSIGCSETVKPRSDCNPHTVLEQIFSEKPTFVAWVGGILVGHIMPTLVFCLWRRRLIQQRDQEQRLASEVHLQLQMNPLASITQVTNR